MKLKLSNFKTLLMCKQPATKVAGVCGRVLKIF